MSFLNLITGGLLFKGGRAEQITADCDLSFGEMNAAKKKARELDEMMKSASILELFAARVEISNRMSPSAPPAIRDWVQKMLNCMDQEIVLRSEYELSPQRRALLREAVRTMNPDDRKRALEYTRGKQRTVAGLDPVIDKELAEDERVLSGAS